MRLALSSEVDNSDKSIREHLLLITNAKEYGTIYGVLRTQVLRNQRLEVRRKSHDQYHLLFNKSFLETLMLAAPFAEISPKIEKILFNEEMARLLAKPIPKFPVKGMVGKLWAHQKVAADMLAREEISLLNDEMGCITGDATIVVNRSGGVRTYTLAQLYRRFNFGKGHEAWKDTVIDSNTRSLMPDGTLGLNKIKKVLKKGRKETVRVTLASGSTVDCTPDHKFWTADGWREIQDVPMGAVIYTNGAETPKQDVLVSVEALGTKMTYDLVMTDPARNFVVNGIIVHNSGKTRAVLAAIVKKQWFPALVVVGNVSGKYVWEREIHESFPNVTCQVVDGSKDTRHNQIVKDVDITIVNVQALRVKSHKYDDGPPVTVAANPAIFDIDWEVFVCDEYHKVKNPFAQQTQGFLALECGRFIGCSGTPILNRPEEAWTFAHKCDPDTFPSYAQFEHQIGVHTPEGRLVGYHPGNMKAFKRWLNDNSLRRRKEHIAAIMSHYGTEVKLPEVIYSSQITSMTREQRAIYKQIKEEMLLTLADGSSKDIIHVLSQLLRLKQACLSPELFGGSAESGKIAQIKEDVADLVASGEKAVIFSTWSTATRILQRELAKYNPAYVDGSIKGRDRQAEVDRFNKDPECKIYIGTIGANQEAITLSAATYVLFANEEWSPMSNAQAEARSAAGGMRGVGITVPVNIIRYHAEDTIEQKLSEKLAQKMAVFQATIERDGGKQVRSSVIQDIRDLLA